MARLRCPRAKAGKREWMRGVAATSVLVLVLSLLAALAAAAGMPMARHVHSPLAPVSTQTVATASGSAHAHEAPGTQERSPAQQSGLAAVLRSMRAAKDSASADQGAHPLTLEAANGLLTATTALHKVEKQGPLPDDRWCVPAAAC